MTKVLFSLVLALVSLQTNLIEWSPSRKLSWDDFKSTPDPTSPNAALTNTAINVEFGYNKSGLTFSIKCSFDKTLSWVRVKNDAVLAHEQGHFDIAEIYARKLNKALKAYQFNAKTAGNDVNKIYNDIMAAHHDAQDVYDHETDYSRNKEKQEEWLKKIAADLKSLQAYANYQGEK